jgi:K+-sensing histidine kinase KdpD
MDKNAIKIINSTHQFCDTNQVLERFKKGVNNPNSLGLGLSIVKRIIDLSHLKIELFCDGTIFSAKVSRATDFL